MNTRATSVVVGNNGPLQSPTLVPAPWGPPILPNTVVYCCPEKECEQKSFKRKPELRRHALLHSKTRAYACPVIGCKRVGEKGFTRVDKLKDHVLAGHDEDELIDCPNPKCCMSFPRDLTYLHTGYITFDNHSIPPNIQHIRVCPMPRCNFKHDLRCSPLGALRTHLLEKHEHQGQAKYADMLAQWGFDAQSCNFRCPICPSGQSYAEQPDFVTHLLRTHLRIEQCHLHPGMSGNYSWVGCNTCRTFRNLTQISDEVRYHRRTILAIFPSFEYCRSVWSDIRCTG